MRKALPGAVLRDVSFTLAIFMIMSGDWVDAMESDSSDVMQLIAVRWCCKFMFFVSAFTMDVSKPHLTLQP